MATTDLPPDLFDATTLLSLSFTVAIVLAAYAASVACLPRSSTTSPSGTIRFLFVWHLADALCHFVLEGSFLYHCFFSSAAAEAATTSDWFPSAPGYLGGSLEGRWYGPQAGGDNPFAQLWMVYARADRRWAGADLVSALYL